MPFVSNYLTTDTRIAERLAKQPCVLVFDAMFKVMLEILVGRIMKHGHDQKHLRQREHVIVAANHQRRSARPAPIPHKSCKNHQDNKSPLFYLSAWGISLWVAFKTPHESRQN